MKQAAWISMVEDEEADDQLKQNFNVARTPHGTLDKIKEFIVCDLLQ